MSRPRSRGGSTLASLARSAAAAPLWVKLTAAAGVALFIVTTYFMDDKRPPPGAEKDPYAGQPARGMFGGGPKPSGRYIPPDQWPRTADGRRIFQATHDWQEVPDDCVLPAGLHVEMNLQTNRKMAKIPR